jgi:hypothetical protein
MSKIRVAKDGHLYERRRGYGGRYYTVQHTPCESFRVLILALLLGPWTLVMLLIGAAAVGWPIALVTWAVLLALAVCTPNL